MKYLINLLVVSTIIFSCSDDSHRNDKLDVADASGGTRNSATRLIAQLPVKFDSINVLLFPIVILDKENEGLMKDFLSGSYSDSRTIAGYYSSQDH